jgi:hypothetical protein
MPVWELDWLWTRTEREVACNRRCNLSCIFGNNLLLSILCFTVSPPANEIMHGLYILQRCFPAPENFIEEHRKHWEAIVGSEQKNKFRKWLSIFQTIHWTDTWQKSTDSRIEHCWAHQAFKLSSASLQVRIPVLLYIKRSPIKYATTYLTIQKQEE